MMAKFQLPALMTAASLSNSLLVDAMSWPCPGRLHHKTFRHHAGWKGWKTPATEQGVSQQSRCTSPVGVEVTIMVHEGSERGDKQTSSWKMLSLREIRRALRPIQMAVSTCSVAITHIEGENSPTQSYHQGNDQSSVRDKSVSRYQVETLSPVSIHTLIPALRKHSKEACTSS